MGKYDEKITDESIWITATPSPMAQTLPFYVMEAGHFHGEKGYCVERQSHDSFLLLYTFTGQGRVKTGNVELPLGEGYGIVLDCRQYHRYATEGERWEFGWIHFKGNAAESLWQLLYSSGNHGIAVNDRVLFREKLTCILQGASGNDLEGIVGISLKIHELYHILVRSDLEGEQRNQKAEYSEYIRQAVSFMETYYGENITMEDILKDIPVSKYHFIRLFSRAMGVTPYSYLMVYRINKSKELLRTTSLAVSEIAAMCGFLDTSNFIAQFKKRTGQKPLQYRKDFSDCSLL